ncbi:MAG: right-handed parallel beta-helix repeat-containing protein [Pseudomonadota bacterium]
MTQKVSRLALGAVAAALVAAPSMVAAQSTFGGQPVTLPPAVEYAAPKTTTTFIVEDGGTGRYQKISQALNEAKDGDVIKVHSGVYNEPGLLIDKSVTIMSDEQGDRRPIVRVSGKKPCLSQIGRDVDTFVANMVFVAGSESCIVVNNGEFTMRDSAVFDTDNLPARMGHILSDERITYAPVSGAGKATVVSTGQAPAQLVEVNGGRVDLSGNIVHGGTQAAIAISKTANNMGSGPSGVTLSRNVIQHSKLHGVLIDGSVNVNFVSNVISDNGNKNSATVRRRNNNRKSNNQAATDESNGGYGIYNVGYGAVDITSNQVLSNANGIYLGDESSHVSLQGNIVTGNKANAIVVRTSLVSQGGNNVSAPRGNSCAIIDHTTAGVFSDRDRRSSGKVCRN